LSSVNAAEDYPLPPNRQHQTPLIEVIERLLEDETLFMWDVLPIAVEVLPVVQTDKIVQRLE
jgi:hypothetical protein